MKKNILWIMLLSLASFSCGDFLEEYSQDLVYASSWEDLDEVLIGNGYMESPTTYNACTQVANMCFPYMFVMDDDVEMFVSASSYIGDIGPQLPCYYYYVWHQDPLSAATAVGNQQSADETVENLYAHIAYVNTIINYVDEFPNDPIEERRRIQGEGQFLRAAYYLMASNLYGYAYDPATGGDDWGVPLKTSEYVVEDHFGRATVGEVYRQITEDLENACVNLRGVRQRTFYRANQLAARTLLSRVYLYMENYDKVIEHCDSALESGIQLADLNMYNTASENADLETRNYIMSENNPEILFTMGGSASLTLFRGLGNDLRYGYVASEALINEFGEGDLRTECYLCVNREVTDKLSSIKTPGQMPLDGGGWGDMDVNVFDNFVLRSVEIYLNKAEAQAMKGDVAGAATTLQPLLNTRYATGRQPSISSMGEQEMVEFIRSERRKEFCFEGHRWPDLKRYAVNTKYPYNEPIRHTIYTPDDATGTYAGYYELGKYGEDEGWILAFPLSEITYNDGMLANPERPQRQNGDPAFREDDTEETTE